MVLEVWAGLRAGSLALLSDAGHNLGDVLGLLLAGIGAWAATRPASVRYTWGWRRGALLAAVANAVLLLAAVAAILWEAVHRFAHPVPVDTTTVVGVAAAGLVVNGFTAWLFARGRHRDVNVRGAFLHMLADAAVSAGVVIGGLAVAATGWLWVDPALSVLIALMVGASAWSLGREAFALSMDAVPAHIDAAEVGEHLRTLPGVTGIHDLHVWPLGTTDAVLTAHLEMPAGRPGDAFLQAVREAMRERFGIGHVTIQVETAGRCGQDGLATADRATPGPGPGRD